MWMYYNAPRKSRVVYFRGAYCAASAARLTNILTQDMFENTPEWIVGWVIQSYFSIVNNLSVNFIVQCLVFTCQPITANVKKKLLYTTPIEEIIADLLSAERCQTYEGGFAGCPGMEAHGGYSFCGLATLILLGHEKLCNLKALLVSHLPQL